MSPFPPSRRLSFTGHRQDTVAGLYDFPAREYSIQGRWPSPDPAGSPLWGLAAVDPSNPQSWNRYAYVLNNPLALIDPLGLCGGEGDTPDLPCPNDNTVNVSAWEGGWNAWFYFFQMQQTMNAALPDLMPPQTSNLSPTVLNLKSSGESYANCVKNDANYFSLQSGLQAVSGGRLGNGWMSSALLGSSVGGAIDFFQSFGNHDPLVGTNAAASEAFSRGIGPAGVQVANTIPNIAFSASASISTASPTSSTSISLAARVSGIIPTGTLSRAAAKLANGALTLIGQVKDPFDLSVASFSAVVCGIGR